MSRVEKFSAAVFLCLTMIRMVEADDPRKLGKYPVGVRTEIFIDAERECAITGKTRTLVTEIWYPATDDAAQLPINRFSDFFGNEVGVAAGKLAVNRFGGQFDKLNDAFKNIAHRGAPVRPGKFPLLVFSHGNGGLRHQNTFQAEYLASHGYVVVAPDHTGNAAITLLPDQVVIYSSKTRTPERRDDRPKDVSFLFTHLTTLSDGSEHWLAGHLSKEQLGLLGHSFGGFTCCRAAELDPRIKAILPLTLAASLSPDVQPQPCTIPLMVMLGDKDRTVKERGNTASIGYFERATGPKYLLNFKDAGHYTFTEMPQINPNFGDGVGAEKDKDGNVTLQFSDALADQRITNQYTVAFFDAFLKQDAAAKEFIDVNHYPDELAFRKE